MKTWRAVILMNGNLVSTTILADSLWEARNILTAQYGADNVKSLMENY